MKRGRKMQVENSQEVPKAVENPETALIPVAHYIEESKMKN